MRRNNSIARAIDEPTVQVRRSDDCLEKRSEGGALSFRAHRASETTHRSECDIVPRSVFAEARKRNRSSVLREVPRLGFVLTITCTLLAHLRKCLIMNGAGEGNRTLVSGLGSPHSTIEPHPQSDFAPSNIKERGELQIVFHPPVGASERQGCIKIEGDAALMPLQRDESIKKPPDITRFSANGHREAA